MHYSESPPVTGAHLHAVDFTEPTLTAARPVTRPVESTHPTVDDAIDHESIDHESIELTDIPMPRVGRRPHVVPPNLADYPDMIIVTPDRTPRAWVLPTGENSGFSTLSAPIEDDELYRELVRLDATRTLVFHGALIGMITTRRATHVCDFPDGHASTAVKCAGCRWFETRVFRLCDADAARLGGVRYALHYVGRSIVPGEVDLPRHELARSGHEVVEAYIVRKRDQMPFITKPGARVLAQAASFDEDIEDAYVNRATA